MGDLRNPKKALAYSKRAVSGSPQPSLLFLSTLTDAYEACGDLRHAKETAELALTHNAAVGGAGSALLVQLQKRFAALSDELRKGAVPSAKP